MDPLALLGILAVLVLVGSLFYEVLRVRGLLQNMAASTAMHEAATQAARDRMVEAMRARDRAEQELKVTKAALQRCTWQRVTRKVPKPNADEHYNVITLAGGEKAAFTDEACAEARGRWPRLVADGVVSETPSR